MTMRRGLFTLFFVGFMVTGFFAPTDPAWSAGTEIAVGPAWDDKINEVMAPFSDAVTGFVFYSIQIGDGEAQVPIVVLWLIFTALIFTFYFRFINFWGFHHALQVVSGRYSDPLKPGEVSHFQALTAALSGTVGLGNIAGVAAAQRADLLGW